MEISARTTARFGLSRSTLRRAGQIAALGFFLVSGLFALHWPMLTTCLGRVQATEGDTRINLYALEHAYRWLIGDPIHSQLWSPPVYFPHPWTGPATETHVGTVWLYWPWRTLGASYDTAFQLWLLSVSILNFVLATAWLSWGRRIPLIASLGGAWIIAFASPRAAQLFRAQLLPTFFPIAILLLVDLLPRSKPPWLRRLMIAGVGFCFAAQLYAGVYIFFFAVVLTVLAIIPLLIDDVHRHHLQGLVKEHWLCIALTAILVGLLISPLLHASFQTTRFAPYPSQHLISKLLPRPQAWVFPNVNNLVYGRVGEAQIFQSLPVRSGKQLFFGVVTSALAIVGLVSRRRDIGTRYLSCGAIGIVIISTAIPLPSDDEFVAAARVFAAVSALVLAIWLGRSWGRWSGCRRWLVILGVIWGLHFAIRQEPCLWLGFTEILPPIRAIRAVSRIGLFLLIPAGLGVAIALNQLIARSWPAPALAIVLGVFCLLEQLSATPSFDKIGHRESISRIARGLPDDAQAFYYSPVTSTRDDWHSQLDGMFVHLATGVPTVNGYLNVTPPTWERLANPNVRSNQDRLRIQTGLREWSDLHPELREMKFYWLRVSILGSDALDVRDLTESSFP